MDRRTFLGGLLAKVMILIGLKESEPKNRTDPIIWQVTRHLDRNVVDWDAYTPEPLSLPPKIAHLSDMKIVRQIWSSIPHVEDNKVICYKVSGTVEYQKVFEKV